MFLRDFKFFLKCRDRKYSGRSEEEGRCYAGNTVQDCCTGHNIVSEWGPIRISIVFSFNNWYAFGANTNNIVALLCYKLDMHIEKDRRSTCTLQTFQTNFFTFFEWLWIWTTLQPGQLTDTLRVPSGEDSAFENHNVQILTKRSQGPFY